MREWIAATSATLARSSPAALGCGMVMWSLCSASPGAETPHADPLHQVTAADARAVDDSLAAALSTALARIEKSYVRDVSHRQLVAGALRGMLAGLDPYSSYMDPAEWKDIHSNLEAQFGGIGVQLDIDTLARVPVVKDVYLGSPALESGIVPGDRIAEIDGRSAEGLDIQQVVGAIRGEVGTHVTLSVRHVGSSAAVPRRVQRRVVNIPSVHALTRDRKGKWDYFLDRQQGIGYIRISRMDRGTLDLAKDALAELHARKVKGLVLDLRANPGGLVSAAIGVADLLVDAGTILTERGRDGVDTTYTAAPGVYTDFPMVTLIDSNTVSAAEILAACLQDQKRAVLVGHHTFGKGYVGLLFPLGDSVGGLKLSVAMWLRPSGKSIDRAGAPPGSTDWGVAPDPGMDVAVENAAYEAWLEAESLRDRPLGLAAATAPRDDHGHAEDVVLDRALAVLRVQMNREH